MRKIALILALCLIAHAADAHAFLHQATPAVGATVTQAPKQLDLFFTEPLEAVFSSVTVDDGQGHRVDTGAISAAPDDAKHIIVPLKTLSNGTYHVVWHATSVDTHKTQGDYTFSVGNPVSSGRSAPQNNAMGAMPDMKM